MNKDYIENLIDSIDNQLLSFSILEKLCDETQNETEEDVKFIHKMYSKAIEKKSIAKNKESAKILKVMNWIFVRFKKIRYV